VKNADHAVLFFKLRDMLKKFEGFMVVTINEEGYYRLYTPSRRPFMAIAVQKKHVGVYSMTLYEKPEIVQRLAPRRIGKSCLGFSSDEDPLLDEVPAFIERCFQHCVHSGQVPMK
jgi:hypothetical protein